MDAGGDFTDLEAGLAAVGYVVSANTVKNYETGKTQKVSADYIDALCRAFQLNPAYFFSDGVPKQRYGPGQAERTLEGVRRLVNAKEPSELRVVRQVGRDHPDGGAESSGT